MKLYPSYEWFITPTWLRRFGPLRLVSASLMDRVGLHFFTLYATLNGVLGGVFTLGNVVLKKTLNADELAIGVISAISVAVLLLGIFGSEAIIGRDKRPFIFWLGFLSRGSFLLFFFCRDVVSFIAVSALFYILNALMMPAVFSMWQSNISSEARNRLWGLTVTVATLVSMVAAYLAGMALDHDAWSYTWVLPVGGVFGIIGIALLAQSPLRGHHRMSKESIQFDFHKVAVQPVKSFIKLLRTDKRFFHFEVAFFLYGFALMLMFPVMPPYIVDVAMMNYKQAGIATGILAQIGMLLLSPVWGILMDRKGPMVLCASVFSILVLFPGILVIGTNLNQGVVPLAWFVYASYLVMGIAMAGVNVAWSLAPVHFAGKADASGYSGAHVTITGIRGSIGPLLGAVGLKFLGYSPVFIASAVLFILAALGMLAINHLNRKGYYSDNQAEPATVS